MDGYVQSKTQAVFYRLRFGKDKKFCTAENSWWNRHEWHSSEIDIEIYFWDLLFWIRSKSHSNPVTKLVFIRSDSILGRGQFISYDDWLKAFNNSWLYSNGWIINSALLCNNAFIRISKYWLNLNSKDCIWQFQKLIAAFCFIKHW